jgi:hypothetical protein
MHYRACGRKIILLNLLPTLGAVGAKAVPPTINPHILTDAPSCLDSFDMHVFGALRRAWSPFNPSI